MTAGSDKDMVLFNSSINFSYPSDFIINSRPGFVQNWPAPRLILSASKLAIFSGIFFMALGKIIVGLILPISAKNGIGSSRWEAISNNILPAVLEPVNPAALTDGCFISAWPIILPLP